MGLLGGLFTKKGTVEGELLVTHCPNRDQYTFLVCFVPCEAGAPPPHRGLPPKEALSGYLAATMGVRQHSGVQSVTALLPVGHYQVVVLGLCFVVRDGTSVQDEARSVGLWPRPRALQVLANRSVTLRLKLEFPAALRPPERTGTLLERVGPELAAEFTEASARLAQGGETRAQFQRLAADARLERLLATDAEEFRLLARILLAQSHLTAHDGAQCGAVLGQAQFEFGRVMPLVETEPATQWLFHTMWANYGAQAGPPETAVRGLRDALTVLPVLFAGAADARERAHHFVLRELRNLARGLIPRGAWQSLFEIVEAVEGHLEALGGSATALGVVLLGYRVELLAAANSAPEARRALLGQLGAPDPGLRQVLVQLAEEDGLLHLLALLASAPGPEPAPGVDPLAAAVEQALRRLRPDVQLRHVPPDHLELRTRACQLAVTLSSLRRQAEVQPADIERFAARSVEQFAALEQGAATPDPARFFLVLRSRELLDQAEATLRAHQPGASLVRRPFAGDLVVSLVDAVSAELVKSLDVQELHETLGLSVDEALARGRANTERAVRLTFQRAQQLWLSSAPFGASTLLFPAAWAELAAQVTGELWVTPVDRDNLLAVDTALPGAVAALTARANQLAGQSPQPLPRQLFRWRREGFAWVAD